MIRIKEKKRNWTTLHTLVKENNSFKLTQYIIALSQSLKGHLIRITKGLYWHIYGFSLQPVSKLQITSVFRRQCVWGGGCSFTEGWLIFKSCLMNRGLLQGEHSCCCCCCRCCFCCLKTAPLPIVNCFDFRFSTLAS